MAGPDDVTDEPIRSESGIPLKNHYGPDDVADLDYERDLGDPGAPPYTRGPYPHMYRSRDWRIAQLVGAGRPEDSNTLWRFAQEAGGGWINFEPDQITTCHMFDPDHPEVMARKDDVGLSGAPYIGVRDFASLLDGVDMETAYMHMVGTPWINAGFFAVAEERGVPLDRLHGTGQGEMFIPYVSTPFKDLYPPRGYLVNNCDVIEFHLEHVPNVVPVSCAGHNIRSNGIGADQELAIVLAWNIEHLDELLRRGRYTADEVAYALGGVNFSIGRSFFEEVAKLRAARRMWSRLLSERYGVTDERAMRMRIHGFSADRDCTREQPLINIVRSAYRTVAAALGGVQSLGVAPYDEALAAPSTDALLMAIRTQQIIQVESEVTAVADPLAGSYYVESLTDELEQRARDYLARIEDEGGFVATLESGWLHQEVYRAAIEQEAKLESGERELVGSNCFVLEDETFDVEPFRAEPAWEDAMERLHEMRRDRGEARTMRALDELRRALEQGENQLPAMIEAQKALATVGEVGQVYRDVWGTWTPPIPF